MASDKVIVVVGRASDGRPLNSALQPAVRVSERAGASSLHAHGEPGMDPQDLSRTLRDVVTGCDYDALAGVVGVLAEAHALAWVRIQTEGPQHDPGRTVRPVVASDPDVNLSATEAARRLGISRDWLYKNADKLSFARHIGRRRVFSARGLERWNREQARPS